ncbi:MAG: serine/threonine-protein kinase [Acidobacteriota bacterium]
MNDWWQKIDTLFQAALELQESERSVFFDQVCGSDPLLRQELESLLAHHNQAENFLNTPPINAALKLITAEQNIYPVANWDRYEFIKKLGEGGMGQVYLVRDPRLKRQIAIKFLKHIDRELSQRFTYEAQAQAKVEHEHICKVYEVGEVEGHRYIAMQFINGRSLREMMQQVTLEQNVKLIKQVAEALHAAHKNGLIHRDIKPDNIMVEWSEEGELRPYIMDFGLAKQTDIKGQTITGTIMGTPAYMSPEQVRGEINQLDRRSDVYSLGATFYELLVGKPPFGTNAMEILRKVVDQEPTPIRKLNSSLPVDLETIVMKCLEKDPKQRYASTKQLAEDLERYLNAEPIQAKPVSLFYRVQKLAQKHRLLVGLSTAVFLVIIVLTGLSYYSIVSAVSEVWEEVRLNGGHTAAVRKVVFSPDGRLLVSCGEDSKVIVWDFARRVRLATLTDHSDWVVALAFSPDGRWFATGSRDKTVIVWDALQLQKLLILREHPCRVQTLAFSRDGKLLACSSEEPNKITTLWETDHWQKVQQLPDGQDEATTLIFSPDNRWLLISNEAWDIKTGKEVGSNKLKEVLGVRVCSLSKDNTRLVRNTGSVYFFDMTPMWHLELPQVIAAFINIHQDSGRAVAISPDDSLVATAAENIILWDMATQKRIARLEYDAIPWSLNFSPDGRWLVSSHADGAILLWDVSERQRIAGFGEHSSAVQSVAFSPDGKYIASGSDDCSIIIWSWNGATWYKEAVLLGHSSRVTGIAFSQNGKWLASCDKVSKIIIWDLERDLPKLSIGAGTGPDSFSLAISPDGHWIVTTLGIFESETGRQVVNFLEGQPSPGQVYGLAFSKDGRWLACVSPGNSKISLWETSNWQMIDSLELTNIPLISVSFSPDSSKLVTGDDNGAVRLWSISPLKEIAVLGYHKARIKSVAFSPDGKQVASSSDDKTINLWNVEERQLQTQIGTHIAPVRAIAFSPDGRQLVCGENDRAVRLYTRHKILWGQRLD